MDADNENDIALLQALKKIKGAGRYHVKGKRPFLFPGIRLKSGEELAFPLPPSQAMTIKEEAEAAPYGKGTETVHDETIRKCWQIDAGDLEWSNPKWSKVIDSIAREVADDLGVEGTVVAEPYKLLLYEKGGFFLPHRDTEKIPRMFGSLIVNLPSLHKGGELVIRHDEREKTVKFSKGKWREKIRFAAFFADCEHEVLPVTKGFRLCLVYNLAIKRSRKPIPDPSPSGKSHLLLPGLEQLRKTDGDNLTAILLDHRYTEANFKVATLKGDDRARAKALFEAAEKTGLAARLALVSLYQMGELEGAYDHYHSYRRGRGSSSDEEGEMGEIYEESLSVDDWRTPTDRSEKLGRFSITETQIISPEKLGEGEPDEEFAEGFTGNAGCTMEHWYRRAAIVLWKKDKESRVLARYNFHGTCLRFEKLVAKKNAAKEDIIDLGTSLIEEGKRQLDKASEYVLLDLAKQSLPIVTSVAKAKSRTLFSLCQGAFLSNVLTAADPSIWKQLLNAFGAESVDVFLNETTPGMVELRKNSLIGALSALLKGKPFKEEIATPIAIRLMELLSAYAVKEKHYARRREQLSHQIEHFHVAIAASFLIPSQADRERLREFLWSGGSLHHIRKILGPALLAKTHRNHFATPESISIQLLSGGISVLQSETKIPLHPYPDWSRPISETGGISRDKTLFNELRSFMRDADNKEYRFKRNQEYRTLLEDYICSHQLDLDCSTETRGTPHTLACRKNDQSYHRAVNQRREDEKLLKRLSALLEKQP